LGLLLLVMLLVVELYPVHLLWIAMHLVCAAACLYAWQGWSGLATEAQFHAQRPRQLLLLMLLQLPLRPTPLLLLLLLPLPSSLAD